MSIAVPALLPGLRRSAAGLLCLLLASCSSARFALQAVPVAPSPPRSLPGLPQASTWPAAPTAQERRLASAIELQQSGSQRIADSGGQHIYSPPGLPAQLVLAPDKGGVETASAPQQRAWALYRFDGLLSERPQRLQTDVGEAPLSPGGSPLPVSYYLGLSDYSLGQWQWHGPFTTDADILLNGAPLGQAARVQRMIDAGGSFFACLLVDSRGQAPSSANPAGQLAVGINSLKLTASGTTLTTRPLLLSPSLSKTGAAAVSRGGSALLPPQFPLLAWEAFLESDFRFASCSATSVEVWRRGPDDAAALLVGQLQPQLETFIDPLNLADGAEPAQGGNTYQYLLRASNSAGPAGWSAAHTLTVPMLAPQLPVATLNGGDNSCTRLSWQACDGALRYVVERGSSADGQDAQLLGEVNAPGLSYLDTSAEPAVFYWYFVSAVGPGDGRSSNGLEQGAASPRSVPAQGLRAVVLTLDLPGGQAGGAGSAAQPYLLDPGTNYQFRGRDQNGKDLSLLCSFSVDPPAAASFGPAGLLQAVQPGAGDFSVNCRFSLAGYEWHAQCHCRSN